MYYLLKIGKYFLILVCLFFLLMAGAILIMPEPSGEEVEVSQTSSKIYDRNGELLYEILIPERGKQDFISLDKISPHLIQAVLAVEDQDFYQHYGLDFSAILRALWQNFYYGEIISGASTIEQQLARNLYGNQTRNLENKIKESLLALKLDFKYNKNEILEKYLNTIYFGNLSYGVETAAQTYFGKTAQKLNLAESAYLAALPQAPSLYSPYANLEKGIQRQKQILELLKRQNKITNLELQTALEVELNFLPPRLVNLKAPHFVLWLLGQWEREGVLEEIATGGYEITTTLDLGLQTEIQNLVDLHLKNLQYKNITNAAVVVLDQTTGEVLAMLGSKDYFDEKIDGEVNLTLSLRQPGSTLKPFLYALAFEKGFSPESTILDEPVQFQTAGGHPYEPKNYDLQYHGIVSMREALAQSLNIPAVKILNYLTVPVFLNFLDELGFSSLDKSVDYYGLALALGSGEVRLLELTHAYGILANQGQIFSLKTLLQIGQENSTNNALAKKLMVPDDSYLNEQIISPQSTRQVTSILSDNYARTPAFGSDSVLKFSYPVAVKTGTSRNFRDNWTLGYTPLRTVGVWVGNNDTSPMLDSSGVTGAAPLFHVVMEAAMRNLPRLEFSNIDNLETNQERLNDFEKVSQEGKNSVNSLQNQQNLILYPFSGDRFQISLDLPLEKQTLTLRAKIYGQWFLNQKLIGTGEKITWNLQKGEFKLRFETETENEEIKFFVE